MVNDESPPISSSRLPQTIQNTGRRDVACECDGNKSTPFSSVHPTEVLAEALKSRCSASDLRQLVVPSSSFSLIAKFLSASSRILVSTVVPRLVPHLVASTNVNGFRSHKPHGT